MLQQPNDGRLEIDTALNQQFIDIESIGRDEQIFENGDHLASPN